MNAEDVAQLEAAFGCSLPAQYLEVLQNYPVALRHANRAMDNSDAEGTVPEVDLLRDVPSVIEINLEARSHPMVAPDGIEYAWPDQFMIIGETGSGDYYCIDLNGEVEGVMQYNHQAVEFEVIADSMSDFIEILTEVYVADGSASE